MRCDELRTLHTALEYTGLDTNLTKLQIATSIFFLALFFCIESEVRLCVLTRENQENQ